MWAGLVAFFKASYAIIPALSQILSTIDKWFNKSKAQKDIEAAQAIGEAIKKAENGDTSEVENIINKP